METAKFVIMFAGSFNQMPFSEVLRLLSSSQQTGALIIREAETEVVIGQLFMQMGQLIDAVQGSHSGLDAVQELCQWIDADFAFEASAQSQRQTLVAYPTEKLIEKIKLRTDELKEIRDFMPAADDVPVYQSGMDASALNMTPDELALLLQCSGEKNVEQIAEAAGRMTEEVSVVLARFRSAGIILLEESASTLVPEPMAEDTAPVEENTEKKEKKEKKAVRYWRGHIVE